MEQGIGNIQSPRRTGGGAFSDGFDEGFDTVKD
jgi:hypothetical protein